MKRLIKLLLMIAVVMLAMSAAAFAEDWPSSKKKRYAGAYSRFYWK